MRNLEFSGEPFDAAVCLFDSLGYVVTNAAVQQALRGVCKHLRPGGLFAFNIESPIHFVCWNDEIERVDDRLHLDYFGMRRWEDRESVNFQLPQGDWIRLFRANGFEVEDLIEPRPPANARTTYLDYAELGWARRWPGENIWKLRKTR